MAGLSSMQLNYIIRANGKSQRILSRIHVIVDNGHAIPLATQQRESIANVAMVPYALRVTTS